MIATTIPVNKDVNNLNSNKNNNINLNKSITNKFTIHSRLSRLISLNFPDYPCESCFSLYNKYFQFINNKDGLINNHLINETELISNLFHIVTVKKFQLKHKLRKQRLLKRLNERVHKKDSINQTSDLNSVDSEDEFVSTNNNYNRAIISKCITVYLYILNKLSLINIFIEL